MSKFVPKRLLDTELGSPGDLNTPKSGNASPVSSQSKLELDGSTEAGSRGHFTQFADDFLSIYVRYGSHLILPPNFMFDSLGLLIILSVLFFQPF